MGDRLTFKNQIRKLGIKLGIKQHLIPIYELAYRRKTARYLKLYDPLNLTNGLNAEKRDFEITVSFTTYPARIKTAVYVADAMLRQTLKPDRVVLVLAETEFSSKDSLPLDYRRLEKRGLTIAFTEDLRPHKKYQYTMRRYPDSIIITADDDIFYPGDMIETLFRSYERHPDAISAMRAHRMLFKDGKILPYNDWGFESNYSYEPVFDLMATTGGGVLYPPRILEGISDRLLDTEAIKEVCLNNDDIWLKMLELLCGVPIVLASLGPNDLHLIPGSQKVSLQSSNVDYSMNDTVLCDVMRYLKMSEEELYKRVCEQA